MNAVKIKCQALMVGDWITDNHGFRWQVAVVGDGCAYATCEGDESDPWEFDDKDDQPEPIPITPEILKKNDWYWGFTSDEKNIKSCVMGTFVPHWVYDKGAGEISLYFDKDTDGGALRIPDQRFNRRLNFFWYDTLYVHELQRALRLAGLTDMANNFKV